MYNFGLVKDGGEVIEGVTLTMFHSEDDEAHMMGSLLSKNQKGNETVEEYLTRVHVKADKIRLNWVKNQVRRRLAHQGATEIRPFPL